MFFTLIPTDYKSSVRQKINFKDFDMLVEDSYSGSIPFYERTGRKKVITLLEKEMKFELHVHQIDKLGRDARDIINILYTVF
jgi:hypothetical protein